MRNETFEMYMTVVRHWHDGETPEAIANFMAIKKSYVNVIASIMRKKLGSGIVPYRRKPATNNVVNLFDEYTQAVNAMNVVHQKMIKQGILPLAA